jgi:Zn-dependent protease
VANAPARDRADSGLRTGFKIGTVFGAPVLVMPSWFLIAALVTYFYAPAVEQRAPQLGIGIYPVAFCAALLLLASVFLHELAHAVAARSVGSPPTRVVLDLWGGHTAFEQEMTTPGRSALVSLVGPATNAALAVLGLLISPAVPAFGIGRLLLDGAILANAFVAIFNAMPGLPLDGGRALEALIWKITGRRNTGTMAAGWTGRVVAVALVVWALGLPLARGQGVGATSLIWTALIAVMLWQGATQAIRLARWRSQSADVSAHALMRRAVAVPAGGGLGDALMAAQRSEVDEVVLLGDGGRPVAVLDGAAISAVPDDLVAGTPTDAVARLLPDEGVISESLAADALVRHLQASQHHEYVVVDASGAVLGVLLWDDVVARVARDGD